MNYLDLVGTILSLLGTFFFVKANIKMWPVYILAIIVNSILYFRYKMYASLILENIYLIVSIYGWVFWSRSMNKRDVAINKLENNQYIILISIWIFITLSIYYLMISFTDTRFPIIETIAVGTSMVSQLLSSRKIMECWYAWMIADSLYIYLMVSQGLYFHAILFSCYLVLAIAGLFNWRRLKNMEAPNHMEQFA